MFYVCSFIVSKLLKILSGWNRNRKKNWFYLCFSKKSDKLLKFTLFKILKIGLDKLLFRKKKSAQMAEFLKMVPLARIGLATPSLPMTCSTTELQRRQRKETYTPFKKKSSIIL